MSESEQQRDYSPLLSERGVTTISDTVVSQVAGMAAQEVEGVHMGGGTSRTAGGVLGSITGSESKTSGISVEVGRTETAIDLKMGIEYNKNILQTVEEVRRRITERIQETTGLRIKELNATITDITFPEKEATRRLGPARSTREEPDDSSEGATVSTPDSRTMPGSEATQVEPTSRTHTEGASGPVSEEVVSEEGRPLEEGETGEPDEETTQAETQTSDEATSAPEEEAVAEDRPPEAEATTEQPTEEVAETTDTTETTETAETTETTEIRAETETPEETPEEETPEARMRRRAEERARRRRSQDS